MTEEGTWYAIGILTIVGAIITAWGFAQEHFFQKEMRREREAAELARRQAAIHPAE